MILPPRFYYRETGDAPGVVRLCISRQLIVAMIGAAATVIWLTRECDLAHTTAAMRGMPLRTNAKKQR